MVIRQRSNHRATLRISIDRRANRHHLDHQVVRCPWPLIIVVVMHLSFLHQHVLREAQAHILTETARVMCLGLVYLAADRLVYHTLVSQRGLEPISVLRDLTMNLTVHPYFDTVIAHLRRILAHSVSQATLQEFLPCFQGGSCYPLA